MILPFTSPAGNDAHSASSSDPGSASAQESNVQLREMSESGPVCPPTLVPDAGVAGFHDTRHARVADLAPITHYRPEQIAKARDILARLDFVREQGWSLSEAARLLRVPNATLYQWQRKLAAAQAAGLQGVDLELAFCDQRRRAGAKPIPPPTEHELALVKQTYIRLNSRRITRRGLRQGSSVTAAFRWVAWKARAQVTPRFINVIKDRTRRGIPPSWAALVELPANVLAAQRDSTAPARAWITSRRSNKIVLPDGSSAEIRPGDIYEADDGTVNLLCWVPSADKINPCAKKFGVQLARAQLLPLIDVASRCCVLHHLIIRESGGYNESDVASLLGDAFTDPEVGLPLSTRLERGSWESHRVKACLAIARVKRLTAFEPNTKSVIENFFDRVWKFSALQPGDIGRFRGDHPDNHKIAERCRAGFEDPRRHFLSFPELGQAIGEIIDFLNQEPIEGRRAAFVPLEEWQGALKTEPRKTLPALYAAFFAREQKLWKARRGFVSGRCDTPEGRIEIAFQSARLVEVEGARIRVLFDPFGEDRSATLVLDEPFATFKRGAVLAKNVPVYEEVPQAVLDANYTFTAGERRSLSERKAALSWMRQTRRNWLGQSAAKVQLPPTDTAQPQPIPTAAPRRAEPKAEPTPRTVDDLAALFAVYDDTPGEL